MKLEKDNPKPLYVQVEEYIRNSIEDGTYRPNQKIPSEAELMDMFSVSRITVRGACSRLVEDGVLYRVKGKGTFVSDNKILTTSLFYLGFREQLEQMGFETDTELIDRKIMNATKNIADHLNIEKDDPVMMIKRLRRVSGRPVSLHVSYLPYERFSSLFSNPRLENEQLCILIEESWGITPKRVVETLEAVLPSDETEELFEDDCPLLLLEDTMYGPDDAPYEYSRVIFRGDRVRLMYDFNK